MGLIKTGFYVECIRILKVQISYIKQFSFKIEAIIRQCIVNVTHTLYIMSTHCSVVSVVVCFRPSITKIAFEGKMFIVHVTMSDVSVYVPFLLYSIYLHLHNELLIMWLCVNLCYCFSNCSMLVCLIDNIL